MQKPGTVVAAESEDRPCEAALPQAPPAGADEGRFHYVRPGLGESPLARTALQIALVAAMIGLAVLAFVLARPMLGG